MKIDVGSKVETKLSNMKKNPQKLDAIGIPGKCKID